jgi:hypothetical protein
VVTVLDMFRMCLLVVVCSCVPRLVSAGAPVWTLYRSSVLDESMRIHVATFDVDEPGTYNFENCQTAASLFQNQDGVRTKFWCEQGRFRK